MSPKMVNFWFDLPEVAPVLIEPQRLLPVLRLP
jgi:hypothetical protein